MADYPAMPLYTDAFVADTTHFTPEEVGIYIRHLIYAWRRPDCALPADDFRLANIAGVSLEKWAEMKPSIMALWTYDYRSKTWFQKKQKKVRKNLANYGEIQRQKALKRWGKTKTGDAGAHAQRMQPKPNKEKEKEKEKRQLPEMALRRRPRRSALRPTPRPRHRTISPRKTSQPSSSA